MKEAGLFFLSGLKFFLAPAAGIAMGYSFLKTVLITSGGGSASVLFFYYFGRFVIQSYRKIFPKNPTDAGKNMQPSTKKKIIINFKNKFGLNGLAIASPILISIPLGAVVASRFFKQKRTPIFFIFWVVIWSLSLSAIAQYIKNNFFSSTSELQTPLF
jgi:hypothetical protein